MAAATTLSQSEVAQLMQTIEMFEVIAQSQPLDYQSLEILKEAYAKLGQEEQVIKTAKRIAQAYVQLGQFSSAILEYESILQRHPDDEEARAALREIEARASSLAPPTPATDTDFTPAKSGPRPALAPTPTPSPALAVEDGRSAMRKIFVDGRIITPADFDACWPEPDLSRPPAEPVPPFIHILHEKGLVPVERSLKLLVDRSRLAYLPLDRYDVDVDLTRRFPATLCRRWCILPFDTLGRTLLVATANPFNQEAIRELGTVWHHRLQWYLAAPADLLKYLRTAFR
jgi:tetratricopeptide (TPR) repeat protein